MNARNTLDKVKLTLTYFLFIILLSLTIVVYALDDFSQEDNLKEYYVEYIYKDSPIRENGPFVYDVHKTNCLTGSLSQVIEFPDKNRTIDCEITLNVQKEEYGDAIIREVLFKEDYEKRYSCTFLQCLFKKETLPVVLTKQGHEFLSNTKLFLVLGTIICGLLLLVLSETFTGGLRSMGSVFAIAGVNVFITKIIPQAGSMTNSLGLISPKIEMTLLILFTLGCIMLVTSFIISYIESRKNNKK